MATDLRYETGEQKCFMPGLVCIPKELLDIVSDLGVQGYHCLLVGGCVRDALWGIPARDLDMEVYGMSYAQLSEFLQRRGRVEVVGSAFGIIKFRGSEGTSCDFSIPRFHNDIGLDHRDFYAKCEPAMTVKEAAARRDFTINSMAFDPVRGQLYDYFEGRRDVRAKILRATSDAFRQDPLRVLRGAQLACRFDLSIEPDTSKACRSLADGYSKLPKERISEEFMKWAKRSICPGKLIPYLDETGWLQLFPLLQSLQGVPQDPEWHPEGDVAVHTMHAVNAAARIATREGLDDFERSVLMFAALTHDFAKPETTEKRDVRGVVRWTSRGHEKASGPKARVFLESIGIKSEITDRVVPLVYNHLSHHEFRCHETPARTVRRLAARLAPANIAELTMLIEADFSGRPPLPDGLPESAARMRLLADELKVVCAPEKPIIRGRDVLPYFDGVAGTHIGVVLDAAYKAQIDGLFSDHDAALEWLHHYIAVIGKELPSTS